MKILVTGAGGLLGRVVCKLFVDRGFDVVGLVRDNEHTHDGGWSKIEVDLSSHWSADVLPRQVDVVIHLAQSGRFRDFPDGAEDLFNVNVASTARLLNYSRLIGASQFIFASTGGVYAPGPHRLGENAPIHSPGRLGAYFGSKLSGEMAVHSYAPYLTTTILRPFFIYGLGQKRSMHLARIFDQVKSGEYITLQGQNGIRINPIHVDDAAMAVVELVRRPFSAVVNLAGPGIWSIRQIAEMCGELSGVKPRFDVSASNVQDLVADITLLESRVWRPRKSLKEFLVDISV